MRVVGPSSAPTAPDSNRPCRASSQRRDPRHPSHGRRRAMSCSSNDCDTDSGFLHGTFSSDRDDRTFDGSKVGYYLDVTDYGTGTDEEQTKANGTVGSGLTQDFSNKNKSGEDNGTRERS